MKPIYQELTLNNVLADPMVRLAMRADHVDPQELAAMLAGVAKTLQAFATASVSRVRACKPDDERCRQNEGRRSAAFVRYRWLRTQ